MDYDSISSLLNDLDSVDTDSFIDAFKKIPDEAIIQLLSGLPINILKVSFEVKLAVGQELLDTSRVSVPTTIDEFSEALSAYTDTRQVREDIRQLTEVLKNLDVVVEKFGEMLSNIMRQYKGPSPFEGQGDA
jgi:hypothetical protein